MNGPRTLRTSFKALSTRLREIWQWSYGQVCSFVYFDGISLRSGELLPKGPVLFVGTHRNGIVDAFVYSKALDPMTFVLAKRLHKTFLGRVFFGGIGVVREKDGEDRAVNARALADCADHLKDGGRLFIFPEGTSSLGPKLLEMKPGAAKVALDTLGKRPDLKIIPVSVHYGRPGVFVPAPKCAWANPLVFQALKRP